MRCLGLLCGAGLFLAASTICLAGDDGGWMAVGMELAQAGRPGEPGAGTGGAVYVPWRERRGPAYPGDFWHSFGRDAKELPATLWDDTQVTFTSPTSWVCFALAGAAGIALQNDNGDNQIADHFTRHGSQLSGFWDTVGDAGGNPGTHFALAGGAYLWSLASGDTKTYEVSKTMLNALIINGLFTEALKVATHTESPNGDPLGWPSGHTSSSFCFATVMYDTYGPWVGVPLYGCAAFVGYERIDARNHDFSDVISGALIGIAIGHAVATNHQPRIFGMDVIPYVDPDNGAMGIALTKSW